MCVCVCFDCTEQCQAWSRHTDFMEVGGRPFILAKSWRCSWPDSASHRISNCRLENSVTGQSSVNQERRDSHCN